MNQNLCYFLLLEDKIQKRILKELSKGKIVICDRYSDSTMAYQGFGKELDKDFINSCNKFVTKGITPS